MKLAVETVMHLSQYSEHELKPTNGKEATPSNSNRFISEPHFRMLKSKKIKVSGLNLKIETSEMHSCLRKSMQLCRWAGFFPVEGLSQTNIAELRFNLKSMYSVYWALTLIGQVILTAFTFYCFFVSDLSLTTLSNCVFSANGIISTILILRLARQWPQLIKTASDIENCLSEIRLTKKMFRKCNILCYVVIFLSLVEHTLYKIFLINLVMTCTANYKMSTIIIENYFLLRMPYVYDYVSYSPWKAIFLEWANTQSTFLWSFTDVMTMCFGIYLISYFRDLNKVINAHRCKISTPWDKLRIHYSHLVALVKQVDSKLNYFILLSLFTDLYFICVQLFNTMNQGYSGYHSYSCNQEDLTTALTSAEHFIYYSLSSLFLVSRTLIMCLLAANVGTVAQEPSLALCEVPALTYNIEVQRFHRQLRYTTVALSGVFFYVTRRMILKVVGTIITYELVLLQFGKGMGIQSRNLDD